MLFSLTDRHKTLEPADSGRLHAMEAEVEEVPFDLPPIYPECPSWLFFVERGSPDSRRSSLHASSGKGDPYLVFFLKRRLLEFWYENNCVDGGR